MIRFRPIERLAIANRGEAALRCIRAARALRAEERSRLEVVALFTPVESEAPFVRLADAAVELPCPRGPAAAYLDAEALVEAALRAGADAVWPGWGFLAEDAGFVERVEQAGLAFLGPPAAVLRRLGDKISAKRIAESAGVTTVPWSGEALRDAEHAARCAARLGYPVMLKAAAGGGGRGIRAVAAPEALPDALRAAAAEARSAFGDERLYLERSLEGARHVEVQIAADRDGFALALGCRECSVQRRHQKLLEEAPPPGLAAPRLRALEDAALRLAREAGFSGVGTVEFLLAGDAPHFLEVNPRLQVEHGVTEAVTGLDLVRLQIRIARGESLARLRAPERGVAAEVRLCAEDPDAGFRPAPGTIARFDPPLAPRVRVDTGVIAGSAVPAAFDSLVAKLIATGDDREEALARLRCALADFDLVIAGGATNKGLLLDVLDAPELRAGAVDTGWLDRFAARESERPHAVEALIAASILSYQAARQTARINFYADPTSIAPSRIPPSRGQRVELGHGGESYPVEVYAVGSWRYRVHLDGRAVAATLREEGAHAARLEIAGRRLRVRHDATETGLRVEVEGHAHRFGRESAGEVRAETPAVVVAIDVKPGDRVAMGHPLGVLEAMKMEIGFEAPLSGVVKEVRAHRGQQVAAGDVLLVIDPAPDVAPKGAGDARLRLFEGADPLDPLFATGEDGALGAPDLAAADGLEPGVRGPALDAVRDEVRRVLLGYDAHEERAELLASFLDAPLPEGLSERFRWELAAIRRELTVLADVEQLLVRSPSASFAEEVGPSNSARLRMFVRRLRAGGSGVSEEFLGLVQTALSHYGIHSLEHSDALERAVLRLLATQHTAALRQRLALAVLRRVGELAHGGIHLGDDRALHDALERIASMRGRLSDAVADAAGDASYEIFDRPRIERLAERTSKELGSWLAAAESRPSEPPESILLHLADAPRGVFDRVGRWLGEGDPLRRAIAVAAHLRRLYAPRAPARHVSSLRGGGWFDRLEFEGEAVLGATCGPDQLVPRARGLLRIASESEEWPPARAIELFVPLEPARDAGPLLAPLEELPGAGAPGLRLTVSLVDSSGECSHHSFEDGGEGLRPDDSLHGIHPETARRIDLDRLDHFDLERIPAGEGIYCFHGRSREVASDERIFVLADARGRSPDDGHEAALHLPAFEHAFYEATRALRGILRHRDPKRRLQWNRIALFVAPAVFLDAETVQRLAQRLAPSTRHLGLEKVVVRLALLDREAPERPARPVEFVISDLTGSSLEIQQRTPHVNRLEPRSEYERKVVEARRRRLVYPYEIVRMLTGSARGPAPAPEGALPAGRFEEFDLDAGSGRARSVRGRPFGRNRSSVVFGVITTPTDKVPEGMSRVLVLSDPTLEMGSLSAPECDRLVAAIDLAEQRSIPVEWIPVSSGARIAMESGTENLDATARVVRRIVRFTQAGGVIHVIVHGVNVGAQSYFDALATMLGHTRGALIMTPRASMVLTGRAALEASGAVSAEDEVAIGGFERIMGPNGEAQYFATDLADAYRILYEHYRYTYVVPGERGPRRFDTRDPADRSILDAPCPGEDFETVGEIFDAAGNPGRKRPFPMRAVMQAVVDADGGHLERWRSMVGAETAIVWDAHLGGAPVCLVGIESRNVERQGYRPPDGPASWNAGTLFPLSSKKLARAINAASGIRPVVILANLSGFDGSPESMRKLQLEHGAEIARAVVNFRGPIAFLVVSRYHGGAYVVFSQELNPGLRAAALDGSYASVIGGAAAASVVFSREVRARALADPRVVALERTLGPGPEARERYERTFAEVLLEHQAQVAEGFDAVHSVERALRVGSLSGIVKPAEMRAYLIRALADQGSADPSPA